MNGIYNGSYSFVLWECFQTLLSTDIQAFVQDDIIKESMVFVF